MTHREAEEAAWLTWLARAQLERAARGHDPSDTDQAFEARERVGFRRWLAKHRQVLPGFAARGSRRAPADQGGS